MRYRVDTDFGYVSYDESDREKAFALYEERGIRIRQRRDIYDEGTVIVGLPIVEDNTRRPWDEN